MNEITAQELSIRALYTVTEGFLQAGTYRSAETGRHSDCFVFVTGGSAVYTYGERDVPVAAGDLLYLGKHNHYTFEVACPRYSFLFVDFDFARTGEEEYALRAFSFSGGEAEPLFRRMYARWCGKGAGARSACTGLLYELYAEAVRVAAPKYVPQKKLRVLAPAVQWLSEQSGSEALRVPALAARCGIGEGQFRRLFREVYGVSPVRYVTRLRIERAIALMRFEPMSFADIAEMCGFPNVYYFSRVFAAETGLPPGEYRRRALIPGEEQK